MILSIFTLFHVFISLIGILSGFIVLTGFIRSNPLDSWTPVFLITTAATSITGFFFPVHHFEPAHAVGIISIVALGIATAALYSLHLQGNWRTTYVICSVFALYLNVFVLVAQLFGKVPVLKALAPTQSAPPFGVTQLAVLLAFVYLGFQAVRRFRGVPVHAS